MPTAQAALPQMRDASRVRLMQSRLADNAVVRGGRTGVPSELFNALDVARDAALHTMRLGASAMAAAAACWRRSAASMLSVLDTQQDHVSEYVHPRRRDQWPGNEPESAGTACAISHDQMSTCRGFVDACCFLLFTYEHLFKFERICLYSYCFNLQICKFLKLGRF